MRDYLDFYIDGRWTPPAEPKSLEVVNPASEAVAGRISAGSAADVDRAVAAARRAFASYSRTSRAERLELMQSVLAEYQKRMSDLADAVTEEMGAPAGLAQMAHAPAGYGHLSTAMEVLKTFTFEQDRGTTRILREPVGVCGLITPWNWPLNQIACKVAPALATGCTMVLKPSEIAPFSAQIFAEVMDAAGVPAGVFNLVGGEGPVVGAAISAHPGVDMVSFTGSTRAGVEVARAAAPGVKRVCQELGGKSPNIILDDQTFAAGVTAGARHVMVNSGQSCNAPTRMLVPAARMDEAADLARAVADGVAVGDPRGNAEMGPVASKAQWDKIQRLIQAGLDEGASLAAGGLGRPEGLERGYFVRPTVFANVTNTMTIAREEIFGPVVSILAYESVDQAIEIANDTDYGLAAYVWGADAAKIREIAGQLRAGQVALNGGVRDFMAPFGGYKKSGNGREWGDFAFHDYLEIKAVTGFTPLAAE